MKKLLYILTACLLLSCSGEKENRDHKSVNSVPSSMDNSSDPDTIVITYGDFYKPFAWGEKDKALGVQIDFVEEILVKRLGYKVRHEACPWKRCQKMVREGSRDGFFTVSTPERAEYTVKTEIPFYRTAFVLHTGKNNSKLSLIKTIRNIEDLKKYPQIRHIHMFGSGWHELHLKNLKYVSEIKNAAMIPQMLASGRADLYIEQAEMFRYQVRELGLSHEVITIPASMREMGWHLFIRKDSPWVKIMPQLDRELKKLQSTGELNRIKIRLFKKYGIGS